jgi:hypothetical protein
MAKNFCSPKVAFFRDFYMSQICDMGQDGFTSPPKEGVLRNFFFRPDKIRELGVPKAQHATSRPSKPLVFV